MTLAGVSALAAGIVLLASGALLVVFVLTGKDAWGRANDATTAFFALLMLPATIEVYGRYAPGSRLMIGVPTLVGLLGLVTVASTSGMTAAARLDWLISAKIGAAGFAAFLVWMGAVCAQILGRGGLPQALAWFGFLGLGIALAVSVLAMTFVRAHGSFAGDVRPSPALSAAFAFAYLCFPAWIAWLGVSLARAG
jgi:hypothetical protein